MKIINIVDERTNELIASVSESDTILKNGYKVIVTEENE